MYLNFLLVGCGVNERIIFIRYDQYRLASFLLIIVNAVKIKEEAYEQQASHLTAYKYATRDHKQIKKR